MIVIDASAAVELLLQTPNGREIGSQIAGPETTLHAPHLIDLEVTQVLRRYILNSELTEARGAAARQDYQALDIQRYSHQPFISQIWHLRHNLTAYDAAYFVLTDILDAELLTMAYDLRNEAKDHGLDIVPLS